MNVKSIAITNVGRVRQNNEDNFYLCGQYKMDVDLPNMTCTFSGPSNNCLFSVCDGMGGEAYGELASLVAVRLLNGFADSFNETINEYIEQVNSRICAEIISHGGKRIGTTFAALSLADGTASAFNIGDSRIYFIRNGKISQISEDHTQVQMLINQGFLSKSDAKKHPARHVLTQHLGIFPDEMVIEPFCAGPIKAENGDIFLLCSDGLTDTLSDNDLLEITNDGSDLEYKANTLIESALNTGSRDNITVILVEISDDDVLAEPTKPQADNDAAEAFPQKDMKAAKPGLINRIIKTIKERSS